MDATQMRIRREKAYADRVAFVAILTAKSSFAQTAMLEQAFVGATTIRTSATIDDIRWSVEVCDASFSSRVSPGYLLH